MTPRRSPAHPGTAHARRLPAERIRTGILAVIVALVAATCSAAGDDASGQVGTDDLQIPAQIPDGVPDTQGGTSTPSDTAAPGSTVGSGTATTSPPGTAAPATSAAPPTTAGVPPISGVGGYAAFYLRPTPATAIVLDIHAQSGGAPASATVSHVQRVLSQVSGKPVDLNAGTVSGGARSWTSDEIRALADTTGSSQQPDRAALKLLFLRGGFAGSDSVLGVAVRSDVAAVFPDRLDEAAGVLGDRDRIEDAVTMHEVGHLLGLVDIVLDTGREDPEHPGHSANEDSVMYWAVESTLVGSLLAGGPPTDFDDADLRDLAAIRNS